MLVLMWILDTVAGDFSFHLGGYRFIIVDAMLCRFLNLSHVTSVGRKSLRWVEIYVYSFFPLARNFDAVVLVVLSNLVLMFALLRIK